MSFIPKPQEIYKHFKGNLYQVTAVAEHTETGEKLVVYQALYDNSRVYARPLSMFTERVDREKYPGAEQEFRFELQGPEADRQRAESEPAGQEAEKTSEAGLGAGEPAGQEAEKMPETGESLLNTQAELTPGEPSGQEKPQAGPEQASGQEKPQAGSGQEDTAAVQKPGAEQTEAPVPAAGAEEGEEELSLDPLVLEFLDSDSYEEKLNILAGLHHRITDDMITTMAIASDIEINDGDVEERYEALKACLLTLERYECNRLR